jgi:hypothetical protein
LHLLGADPEEAIEVKALDPLGRCILHKVLPAGTSTLEWTNEAKTNPAAHGFYTIVWTQGLRTRTQRLIVPIR